MILFGASSCADTFLHKINDKFCIDYIVDNDSSKQGRTISGYAVYGIDKLYKSDYEDVLLITSTWYDEIIKQLQEIGFRGYVYSFLHLRKKNPENMGIISLDEFNKNIEYLKEICTDDKSRNIVDSIVYKRINHILDYSDIYEDNQYFVKEIISLGNQEVLVDGGAYDGNTVREFIKLVAGNFCRVYSFEMDYRNYDNINREDFDERVIFYNYGLWNQNKQISFINNGPSSELTADGAGMEMAECVRLDDILHENPTFIKMDIEGAEQEALSGAENYLLKCKPKLAICLYHKFPDLWEIPLYIHKLVPEYKIYIRHHSKTCEETVMYAVT